MEKERVGEIVVGFDLENEMIGLIHSIDSLLPDQPRPIIQLIGAHNGEGVTTIGRELARVASQFFGKSVLILDAADEPDKLTNSEKREPRQAEGGAVTNTSAAVPSSSKADEHNDPFPEDDMVPSQIYFTSIFGFHVGSFSKIGVSLADVLSGRYFQNYMEILRSRFDMVIIDSLPVSESQVGLAASTKVDGVILVVEAESTRWPIVARLKQRIEKSGGTILGVVLNKQKHYIPKKLYKHL